MKISLEEIISRINNYHGDKYNYPFIKDEYLNSHSYITIICNKCEHIFKQQVYSHVNEKNGCPKCVGVLKLTTEQILIRFREIHKDKYEYPKIFKEHENIKSKITVVCKKCSDVFKVSVNHHMYSKSGCRNCHHNKPNTINRILEKSIKVHGENRYSYPYINNEKIGSYDKITIFCNRCKQTFKQRVYSHILIGNGCPKCNKSKAEQSIHNYLLMNKVNFIPQYKFENCKNIRQLPFDFYLPDYNTCIEYDGELHFNKRRDDELDNLKCRKLKDDIKTNFCLKNKVFSS